MMFNQLPLLRAVDSSSPQFRLHKSEIEGLARLSAAVGLSRNALVRHAIQRLMADLAEEQQQKTAEHQ